MDHYICDDYREIIKDWISSTGGRGAQRQLASTIGCMPSHMSQVINGSVDLSMDHAYALASAMGLSGDDADFFLLLVQRNRTARSAFHDHLNERIETLRLRKQLLSERLKPDLVFSGETELRYYTTWYYPAIHTLCAIPEFQTVAALVRRLKISTESIEHALVELERMGLIARNGDKISCTARNIHVHSSSPLNQGYHSLWRNVANQRMQEHAPGKNTHYTALYCLSRTDAERLKTMMLEFIEQTRDVVVPSAEETVVVMNCDLFEL